MIGVYDYFENMTVSDIIKFTERIWRQTENSKQKIVNRK